MHGQDSLLSTREAAALLGVPRRTLEGWRLRGNGPRFVRMPRAVRYRREDLETWVALRLRSSTSDPGPQNAAR
jgi:excisionase family DNA binding protein